MPAESDVRWLLQELRSAREALTSIIALAHDLRDDDAIGMRIRLAANGALGLYSEARRDTGARPRVASEEDDRG
jgi:hypothetical protein